MLTFTDADLESLLDPDAVIMAIREAFGPAYDNVRMPQRAQIDLGSAIMILMPCAIVGTELCGTKIVSVSGDPRPQGRISANYILTNTRSGQTIAVLAANYLTDLRTAATSALATDLLARRDAATLGIFGTGRQAEAHIRLFSRNGQYRRILVCGHTPEKTSAFVARRQAQCAVQVVATDAATCANTADVICTCTSSTEPLFDGKMVRAGTHVNLIGTFQPHAREVDSGLISRAQVFVDTYEGCFAEAGDILVPLNAGDIRRDHIKADLHELLTLCKGNADPGSPVRVSGGREKTGRTSSEDITIFKSVGCALEDLVTARLAIAATQLPLRPSQYLSRSGMGE